MSNEELFEQQFEAVRKFLFFSHNFPGSFSDNVIAECWKDQPHMADHLVDKFKGIMARQNDPYFVSGTAFLNFVFELDGTNKRKFIKHILETYKG